MMKLEQNSLIQINCIITKFTFNLFITDFKFNLIDFESEGSC